VNANSRPRCILSLHSNCWAEIATLAESELAQKKRFPDPGREYSDALDREAAAIVVGKDGTAACSSQELREYFSGEGKHITDRQRLADRCEFYRPGPQVCAVPAQVRRQTCSYYKG